MFLKHLKKSICCALLPLLQVQLLTGKKSIPHPLLTWLQVTNLTDILKKTSEVVSLPHSHFFGLKGFWLFLDDWWENREKRNHIRGLTIKKTKRGVAFDSNAWKSTWEILISRLRGEWVDGQRAGRKTNIGGGKQELMWMSGWSIPVQFCCWFFLMLAVVL